MADSYAEPRRRHRVWPWILGIFLFLLVAFAALAAGGVALAAEALDVRDDLEAAKSQLAAVPELVKAGDTAQFDQVAAEVLVAHHERRRDRAGTPVVVRIGRALRRPEHRCGQSRHRGHPHPRPRRDAGDVPGPQRGAGRQGPIRGRRLQPRGHRGALGSLPTVDAAFAAAQQKVDGIDRSALLPLVDDAIGQVLDVIADTAPLVHTATEVLPTALQMLGDTEPRTYFVMFQNNAEIRATGGNPAASVLVRVEGGRVSLAGQASSTTFASDGLAGRQFIDLPPETLALYAADFPLYSQNYTRTPNFPTTAALFQGILGATGHPIDGVISLDPVALSHMLAVAGPVTVDGIELNSENVVRVLLNETYFRFPDDQAPADAFFAAASAAVFDKLVAGELGSPPHDGRDAHVDRRGARIRLVHPRA